MLYGPNGESIMAADKPVLSDRGTLEGTADFRFYKDTIEYAVACIHCSGVAAGILRIADPALQKNSRTWAEKVALQNECIAVARRRHHCSVLYENKRDASEWLEEISKR